MSCRNLIYILQTFCHFQKKRNINKFQHTIQYHRWERHGVLHFQVKTHFKMTLELILVSQITILVQSVEYRTSTIVNPRLNPRVRNFPVKFSGKMFSKDAFMKWSLSSNGVQIGNFPLCPLFSYSHHRDLLYTREWMRMKYQRCLWSVKLNNYVLTMVDIFTSIGILIFHYTCEPLTSGLSQQLVTGSFLYCITSRAQI